MRYSIVGASPDEVAEAGGANIKQKVVTKIIFADMTEHQASKLRRMGYSVESVSKVKSATVAPPVQAESLPTYTPDQFLDWVGIDSLRNMYTVPVYGQGYNVAILDTGIRESHELVRGRVIYSKNFTNDKMSDGFDHGTGIASIIASVVPWSGILNLKVLDKDGDGTSEGAVDAIEECIDLADSNPVIAPSIINLSLGHEDSGDPNDVLRIACRAAVERGIWVVASAGNSGPSAGTITSPACDPLVIAVGSLDPNTREVSFTSSRGPTGEGLVKPDLVMFGEDLNMASSASDTAMVAKGGTSFSAPFITGICIICYEVMLSRRIVGNGKEEPEELLDIIERRFPQFCVKPEGMSFEKDNSVGYGVPLGPHVLATLDGETRPSALSGIASGLSGLVVVGMISAMMKPRLLA